MRAKRPAWRLVYEGTDITADIAPAVTAVTYTDHEHGKSDEIEVAIEDRDGRWRGAWYPAKGDEITLDIGYEGALMPAGRFRVDEMEFSGPPDVIVVRALAASITSDLRTRKSRAFEGTTLAGIAERIAAEHELSVLGEIDEIPLKRVSQDDETDLAFLRRLAEDYGHAFTVRGTTLVFHRVEDLRGTPVVATLGRGELIEYRLRDKAREIFRACEVSYQDPETKELITHTVTAEGVASGDVLKRRVRAENPAQAEARARALLDRANRRRLAGALRIPGHPTLVAGNNIALAGLGALSGAYHIRASTHRVERREGYTTEVEVERV